MPDHLQHVASKWWARACLVGGITVYLGMGFLAMKWRPDEPLIASIWIFLAAHSAAYMLVNETRDPGDGPPL